MTRDDFEVQQETSRRTLSQCLIPLSLMVIAVEFNQAVVQRYEWSKVEIRPHRHEKNAGSVQFFDLSVIRPFLQSLQSAYERTTYDEHKREFNKVYNELQGITKSADNSIAEVFEETLTFILQVVFPLLGLSFKMTNFLESINAMAVQRCAKIDYGLWLL